MGVPRGHGKVCHAYSFGSSPSSPYHRRHGSNRSLYLFVDRQGVEPEKDEKYGKGVGKANPRREDEESLRHESSGRCSHLE